MTERKPIIAGNWKMYMTHEEAANLTRELTAGLSEITSDCEVIVAPPFTSIHSVVQAAMGSRVQVAGQNLYWEEEGAFTGEVCGPMLKAVGCSHVIIGHSERRQYFGETDETVNQRIQAAGAWNLIPILCVGETLEERESAKTFEVIERQLRGGLKNVQPEDPSRLVVAYEPVWAIGTGRTATPEQAQEVHRAVRGEIGSMLGEEFALKVRILYGGSVKRSNASGLMECADIDGGLVGGASLKSKDFLGIIREVR
jgi:triosephosphate isomerase